MRTNLPLSQFRSMIMRIGESFSLRTMNSIICFQLQRYAFTKIIFVITLIQFEKRAFQQLGINISIAIIISILFLILENIVAVAFYAKGFYLRVYLLLHFVIRFVLRIYQGKRETLQH